MELFVWICLTVLAIFACTGGLLMVLGCIFLVGRIRAEAVIMSALGVALVYGSFAFSPFPIVVGP